MSFDFSQTFVNEKTSAMQAMSLNPTSSLLQPLSSDGLLSIRSQSDGERLPVCTWKPSQVPLIFSPFPPNLEVSIQPNEFDNFVRQDLHLKRKREKRQISNSSSISGYKTGSLEKLENKANKFQPNEERIYVCSNSECNKRFKTKNHLRRHEKIHGGLKPYPCKLPGCTARFSRQDNMMQHYRLHAKKTRPASSAVPSALNIQTLPVQSHVYMASENIALNTSPVGTTFFGPHMNDQQQNFQLNENNRQHPSPVSPLSNFEYSGNIPPTYSSGDTSNAMSFSPVASTRQYSNVYLPTLENSPLSPMSCANVSPIVPLTLSIPNTFACPEGFNSGLYDSPSDVYTPPLLSLPHPSFCYIPPPSMTHSHVIPECPEIKFNQLEIHLPNQSNIDLFACNPISDFCSAPLSLFPISQASLPVMAGDTFPNCSISITPQFQQLPIDESYSGVNLGTGSQLDPGTLQFL